MLGVMRLRAPLGLAALLLPLLMPGPARAGAGVASPGSTWWRAAIADSVTSPRQLREEGVVIYNAAPSSGSAVASGSESRNPDASATVSADGAAGIEGDVFRLRWSALAQVSTSVPECDFSPECPRLTARADLAPRDSLGESDSLVFTLDDATPVTIRATGSLAASSANDSSDVRIQLRRAAGDPVFSERVSVGSASGGSSDALDVRFSRILPPDTYTLTYAFNVLALETQGSETRSAEGSLDLVVTMAPAGPCSDGLDNDGDGLADLGDPGCLDGLDTLESAEAAVPSLGSMGLMGLAAAMAGFGVYLAGRPGSARRRPRPTPLGRGPRATPAPSAAPQPAPRPAAAPRGGKTPRKVTLRVNLALTPDESRRLQEIASTDLRSVAETVRRMIAADLEGGRPAAPAPHPRPEARGNHYAVGLRVVPSEREAIRARARREGRSLSGYATLVVLRALAPR